MHVYRFVAEQSRLTVKTTASGFLAFLGHSPSFAVKQLHGTLSWDDAPSRLEVVMLADSLRLVDRAPDHDRIEIESRMRREVLLSVTHPEICYQASVWLTPVDETRFTARLQGQLTLLGVTRPCSIEAELTRFRDGLRLVGSTILAMSDFGIRPVTALAGAIQLRDQVEIMFDMPALLEGA